MATKSLLKSSMEKRGSSDRKRFERKRTRRGVKLRMHQICRDPFFADELDIETGRSMGPKNRNRGWVTDRFLARFLLKHAGEAFGEVSKELRDRVGTSWKAKILLRNLDDLFRDLNDHGGIWINSSSVCGGNTVVLYVNDLGILCREDRTSRRYSCSRFTTESSPATPSPKGGWMNWMEIHKWKNYRSVRENNGTFFWVSHKYGYRVERTWVRWDDDIQDSVFEDRETYPYLGKREVPFSAKDLRVWKRVHPIDKRDTMMH